MTGTPQNTLQVPLYKICCLIPYQVNEQDIVYLSSVSEINRFLQVHGIGDRFGVDSGRISTATCTEDLPIISENIKIANNIRGKRKETYDRQSQINWRDIKNWACYRNEIVPWHKCSKNESVVHFCKKSNSSLCYDTNNSSGFEKVKKETAKSIHTNPIAEPDGHIALSNSNSLKKVYQKSRSVINKTKKAHSFTNRSFIRILKKQKKNWNQSVTKLKNEIFMKEKSTDKTNDPKISLLAESVVCETATQSCIAGLGDNDQEKVDLNQIKAGETHATSDDKSAMTNVVSKDNCDAQSKKDNIEIRNSSQLSNTSSDKSITFDCNEEEQNNQNVDMTFYESPLKFVENMSECVMRRFISEECDDSWLKLYDDEKIPKKNLGIDKDLSELYILKKMAKHDTATCLVSHLTPRQKRLLAKGIVHTLEEFNINGSRWGGLSQEILSNVCKLFKNQRDLVP